MSLEKVTTLDARLREFEKTEEPPANKWPSNGFQRRRLLARLNDRTNAVLEFFSNQDVPEYKGKINDIAEPWLDAMLTMLAPLDPATVNVTLAPKNDTVEDQQCGADEQIEDEDDLAEVVEDIKAETGKTDEEAIADLVTQNAISEDLIEQQNIETDDEEEETDPEPEDGTAEHLEVKPEPAHTPKLDTTIRLVVPAEPARFAPLAPSWHGYGKDQGSDVPFKNTDEAAQYARGHGLTPLVMSNGNDWRNSVRLNRDPKVLIIPPEKGLAVANGQEIGAQSMQSNFTAIIGIPDDKGRRPRVHGLYDLATGGGTSKFLALGKPNIPQFTYVWGVEVSDFFGGITYDTKPINSGLYIRSCLMHHFNAKVVMVGFTTWPLHGETFFVDTTTGASQVSHSVYVDRTALSLSDNCQHVNSPSLHAFKSEALYQANIDSYFSNIGVDEQFYPVLGHWTWVRERTTKSGKVIRVDAENARGRDYYKGSSPYDTMTVRSVNVNNDFHYHFMKGGGGHIVHHQPRHARLGGASEDAYPLPLPSDFDINGWYNEHMPGVMDDYNNPGKKRKAIERSRKARGLELKEIYEPRDMFVHKPEGSYHINHHGGRKTPTAMWGGSFFDSIKAEGWGSKEAMAQNKLLYNAFYANNRFKITVAEGYEHLHHFRPVNHSGSFPSAAIASSHRPHWPIPVPEDWAELCHIHMINNSGNRMRAFATQKGTELIERYKLNDQQRIHDWGGNLDAANVDIPAEFITDPQQIHPDLKRFDLHEYYDRAIRLSK